MKANTECVVIESECMGVRAVSAKCCRRFGIGQTQNSLFSFNNFEHRTDHIEIRNHASHIAETTPSDREAVPFVTISRL